MNRPLTLVLFRRWMPGILCSAFAGLLLASCRSVPPAHVQYDRILPIRFLVTLDDGPSIRRPYNPTLAIADQLATNDIQPGIKAIFFVQTEHPRGGGTQEGREIMHWLSLQGHTIGIHSVSPLGHVDHTKMPTNDLPCALEKAKDLIRGLTGSDPLFVRPPYGVYNLRTQSLYADLHLRMLMADVPAHDGVIYGYHLVAKWHAREHFRAALENLKAKLLQQDLSVTPIPVIVSFHDVNPYTAKRLTEYLHFLVEEAQHIGLTFPEKPFYATAEEVTAVGIARCVPPPLVPTQVAGAAPTTEKKEILH